MEVKREYDHIYRIVFSDDDIDKLTVISKALSRDIEDMVFMLLEVTLLEISNFLIRKDDTDVMER